MTASNKGSIPEDGETDGSSPTQVSRRPPTTNIDLYSRIMADYPFPFLFFFPIIFIILIAIGFSRPDVFEIDVGKLWIPSDSSYARNLEYAERVGATKANQQSTFAAMALSRYGENLFKEENLNAIVERMKQLEGTQIEYKGNNFTWEDICWKNGISEETTYKFPCFRLSPMDLFEEARWYFKEEHRVAWYQEVKTAMIKPLMVRYGVMVDMCMTVCEHVYLLRMNPDYAVDNGYPASHAGSMTDLLQDIYNLELGNSCRICIEDGIDIKMDFLKDEYVVPAFTILTQQLRRLLFELEQQQDTTPTKVQFVVSLIRKTASITTSTTRADVEDFYTYHVIRGLYSLMGAKEYQKMYRSVNDPMYRNVICDLEGVQCPPLNVSLGEAEQSLLDHADSPFSSLVTFGSPFPFFGVQDGSGPLFAGNQRVGGSGINMSAPLESLVDYLDLYNRNGGDNWKPLFYDSSRQDGFIDPFGDNPLWERMVATNPVYAWFMAGETEMTAHCGNGDLLGTNTSDMTINLLSETLVNEYSQKPCTKYNVPFEKDGIFTQQHFARMWYDLLVDSPFVLDIKQGADDPYSWTLGLGCDYEIGGSRFSYSGQSEDIILQNASIELYNIDEGVQIGVVNRKPLIGDVGPSVGEYSLANPLQHVGLMQNVYLTLSAQDIVRRVKHVNRPGGILNVTEDDAKAVLKQFKARFEDSWSREWDKDGGEAEDLQFVGFFGDSEVPGTIGRFLSKISERSALTTAISIIIVAILAAMFQSISDSILSQFSVTIGGGMLLFLALFAAIGLGKTINVDMTLNIIWGLPFVLLSIGFNGVFQTIRSMKEGYMPRMKDTLHGFSMASLVNTGTMLTLMMMSNVPAIYMTAQVALFGIIFVYLVMVFCFPAYCLLDKRRQDSGRWDIPCCKSSSSTKEHVAPDNRHGGYIDELFYHRLYKRLVFGQPYIRVITHSTIWALAAFLLGLGLFGISNAKHIGVGLEDVLPSHHQGNVWATSQSEILGTWVINMNWPDINYTDTLTQLKMAQQFERVVALSFIEESNTRNLWISDFALWTTRQCDYNTKLEDPANRKCGRDQVYGPGSTCSGTWKKNVYDLREKYYSEDQPCQPHDGGVCRRTSKMHPNDLLDLDDFDPSINQDEVWCPVFEGWSEDKFKFCLRRWHDIVDGAHGGLLLEHVECEENETCKDRQVTIPIPYSRGPPMLASSLFTHELILKMIQETRSICDEDEYFISGGCWMSGAPFDYWTQYEQIEANLTKTSGAILCVGFALSLLFLLGKLFLSGNHGVCKVLAGSILGATLVTITSMLTFISVVGLQMLADVSLTLFTTMGLFFSIVLSVHYSACTIVHWIEANRSASVDRVEDAMQLLAVPNLLSLTSTIAGIACLAFASFGFITRFFVVPLTISLLVAHFFGTYWLPAFLTLLDFDFVRLGKEKAYDAELLVSPLSKLQSIESHSEECGNFEGQPEGIRDLESNVTSTRDLIVLGSDNEHGDSKIARKPKSLSNLETESNTSSDSHINDDQTTQESDYRSNEVVNQFEEPQEKSHAGDSREDHNESSDHPQIIAHGDGSDSVSFDCNGTRDVGSFSSISPRSGSSEEQSESLSVLTEARDASSSPTLQKVETTTESDNPLLHYRVSPPHSWERDNDSPRTSSSVREARSMDTVQSATFFRNLPIRRSLSSPRRKFSAPTSPRRPKPFVDTGGMANDNALLNTNAIYNANVKGYDFSRVLNTPSDASAEVAVSTKKREVVKGGTTTGEEIILSVRAADERHVSNEIDTVKI